jgi:hypothetical protein
MKKAKKFHTNLENEDLLNSRWQEQSLRHQQALELTGEEHTVQCMEEELQRGPAEVLGFEPISHGPVVFAWRSHELGFFFSQPHRLHHIPYIQFEPV